MGRWLAALLRGIRQGFDRCGIAPPAWLLRYGNRLYERLLPALPPPVVVPAAAPAAPVPAAASPASPGSAPDSAALDARLAQIEARLALLTRTTERIEAALHLQRLQR